LGGLLERDLGGLLGGAEVVWLAEDGPVEDGLLVCLPAFEEDCAELAGGSWCEGSPDLRAGTSAGELLAGLAAGLFMT
jgi:hypothetical protein